MAQPHLFLAPSLLGLKESVRSSNLNAKSLGAYYTDIRVAEFLVAWAVREPSDTVMDPSFGGGAFLNASANRVTSIGGNSQKQVYGVEMDATVYHRISSSFISSHVIAADNLIESDFFELNPGHLRMDAIVGNPPFIRFHRFAGEARAIALLRSRQAGVNISGLTSSWVPFILHSLSMLKKGGRLAMVVPAEIAYASYAAPLLTKLARSFGSLRLLSFRKKLFEELSEDTMLLLAEDYGQNSCLVSLADFDRSESIQLVDGAISGADLETQFCSDDLASSAFKISELYIDQNARSLYRELAKQVSVRKLGDIARVGIGYVTGANGFFHFRQVEANARQIPSRFLKKSVLRGRALKGIEFTSADWESAETSGFAGYVLALGSPRESLPKEVQQYLAEGEKLGVAEGYKCKNRPIWYAVPTGLPPDGFLNYMSGNLPRLVVNTAQTLAPNTLHVVNLRAGANVSMQTLAVSWQTSLSTLSAEIEGHAMGGGMLKIEPGEAQRLLLAVSDKISDELAIELDQLIRTGNQSKARELADQTLLIDEIGLTRKDCTILSDASKLLAKRRCSKGVIA